MHMPGKIYFIIIFTLLLQASYGQKISIDESISGDFTVCDTGIISYSFLSSYTVDLTASELTIELPPGIQYLPGSIEGAFEKNIIDQRQPIFEIQSLMPGSKHWVRLELFMDCEARTQIDDKKDFVDTLTLIHNRGSELYLSNSHEVLTPHLVMDAPLGVLQIAPYESVERAFKIRNNRRGKVDRFIFRDEHDIFRVELLQGKTIINTPTTLEVELGAEDFIKIGNGDIYFDKDEEIMLTERLISEEDCESKTLASYITVEWGCEGEYCQYQDADLVLQVNQDNGQSKLVMKGDIVFPDCPCDIYDARQNVTIVNTGTSVADSIIVELRSQRSRSKHGILESPFWAENTEGDSIPLVIIEKEVFFCDSIYWRYLLKIPNIKADDTLNVFWYYTLCSSLRGRIGHEPQGLRWTVDLSYQDKCGTERYEATYTTAINAPRFSITTTGLNITIGEGDIYPFINRYESDILTDYLHGQLTIIYNIPCGFSFVNNDFILDGERPLFIDTLSGTEYHVTYVLPFKRNDVKDTIYARMNCSDPCLDTLGYVGYYRQRTSCRKSNKVIRAQTKAVFCANVLYSNCPVETKDDVCGYLPNQSSQVLADIFCDENDSLEVVIPGYVDFEGLVERTSLGLADSDNNRFPDTPFTRPDKSLIDLKRLMELDTFELVLKGTIVSDVDGVGYDSLFAGYNVNGKVFRLIGNEISIWDASSGIKYRCNSDMYDLDTGLVIPFCGQTVTNKKPTSQGVTIVYHPGYLKKRNCAIPEDFLFEDGDSIEVILEFVFDAITEYRNLRNENVGGGLYLYDNDYKHFPFTCGTFEDNVTLMKSEYKITPVDEAQIAACSRPNAEHYFKIIPNPGKEHETNFFPFEYRNIFYLDSFSISFDPAITVDSLVVKYWYKDSFPKFDIPIASKTIIPNRLDDTTWTFNSKLVTSYDDGYEIWIEPHISVRDCRDLVNGLETDGEYVHVFTNNVPPYLYYLKRKKKKKLFDTKINLETSLEKNYYQLILDIVQPSISGYDDKARWKADVQLADNLDYFKLKVLERDPGLFNIRAMDDLGNVYNAINDEITIQGYRPESIKSITVIANNRSCERQRMKLISAWACDTVADYFERSCAIDTFDLSVKSDTPRLGFKFNLTNAPYTLCDTLDYLEVVINNADKGAAFDLMLDMFTTVGFKPVRERLTYALDSAVNFKSLTDPVDKGLGHYQWNLTEVIPEYVENGFPGEKLPNNTIYLRLGGVLDCSFEPGSLMSFEVSGLNNCGRPTNSLRISRSIPIKEIQSNDNFVLLDAVLQPENLVCKDTGTIQISLDANNDFAPNDIISVSLPEGIRYIPGSTKGINNFTPVEPQLSLVNGIRTLKWDADRVVNGFRDIRFSIGIESDPSILSCDSYRADIKVLHSAKVFCRTSGDSCFVDVVSGIKSLPIRFLKGSQAFVTVKEVTFGQDSTAIICFTMVGERGDLEAWTDSLRFVLYDDHQGNGLSGDDHPLGRAAISQAFQKGDTAFICMTFKSKLKDPTCHFILELEGDDICICSNAYILFDQPIVNNFERHVLCPGASIDIGQTAQQGYDYSWTGGVVNCTDCPKIKILHDLLLDSVVTRSYVLNISDSSGCSYTSTYEITYLPIVEPELLNYTVCIGDSLILYVDGVMDVKWFGPGINGNMNNPVMLKIFNSSEYYVQYKDANGCEGRDSFNIVVYPRDSNTYSISMDTTILFGESAQLWVTGEGKYRWSPIHSLDCVSCPNPIASPDSTTTYEVSITDSNGCIIILEVTVFVVSPPCDQTSIYVPNVFSPNDDGQNDILYVNSNYIDEILFVIYDRWGEKVFETTDINVGWDGTYKGRALAPDAYGYYLRARCIGNEQYIQTGNVTILK